MSNWPSALADVLLAGYTIREPGLIGWWPMNTVSEYPTGTATYFNDTFANTTGWSVQTGLGSLSVSGGYLIYTPSGGETSCILRYSPVDFASKTFRIKTRYDSLISGINYRNNSTYVAMQNAGNGIYDSFPAGSVGVVQFQVTFAASITGIYFDWAYVGDGSYTANTFYDRSGFAYHSTLYGATPTTGKSGNGLIIDGVNDYTILALPAATYSTLYLSTWLKLSAATSYCLFDPRNDAGVGGAALMTDAVAYYIDGGSTLARVPYDGNWHHVVAPMTSMVVNKAWIGRTYAGASWLSGSIDELRFYTTLSADRRYQLYANPSTYEALPAPDISGYNESRQDGVIRSSMDAGPAKVRPRFTATPRFFQQSMMLDRYQKQVIEQFYTSLGGSNSFTWTHPDTGESLTARFLSQPQYSLEGGLFYRASFGIEVLP